MTPRGFAVARHPVEQTPELKGERDLKSRGLLGSVSPQDTCTVGTKATKLLMGVANIPQLKGSGGWAVPSCCVWTCQVSLVKTRWPLLCGKQYPQFLAQI